MNDQGLDKENIYLQLQYAFQSESFQRPRRAQIYDYFVLVVKYVVPLKSHCQQLLKSLGARVLSDFSTRVIFVYGSWS